MYIIILLISINLYDINLTIYTVFTFAFQKLFPNKRFFKSYQSYVLSINNKI